MNIFTQTDVSLKCYFFQEKNKAKNTRLLIKILYIEENLKKLLDMSCQFKSGKIKLFMFEWMDIKRSIILIYIYSNKIFLIYAELKHIYLDSQYQILLGFLRKSRFLKGFRDPNLNKIKKSINILEINAN
ncbi:hypothetical protein BpHYR1_022167 [Brachionus plicatilis]|uniref:Uncharacterized protein n=1 Tax=Brachionus plicatilis TaxID=10195 RepID=A0A3M7QL08_BRAPC|nr:hypothetical protein BpHYR1_022167 [Brachionus plicatilis]